MRTRQMERDALHGWPTEPELLAADYPEWHIWRDLLDGHGEWRATRGDRAVSAETIAGLRAAIEAAEDER